MNGGSTIKLKEMALTIQCPRSNATTYGDQEDDRRMDRVLTSVTRHFDHSVLTRAASTRGATRLQLPPLAWDQVPRLSGNFPPCFGALQARLESRGRVGHHARVAYTLFLKEIGMGFDQAVAFWEHYYSRPTSSGSGCSHSWQADRSRYVYSIKGKLVQCITHFSVCL